MSFKPNPGDKNKVEVERLKLLVVKLDKRVQVLKHLNYQKDIKLNKLNQQDRNIDEYKKKVEALTEELNDERKYANDMYWKLRWEIDGHVCPSIEESHSCNYNKPGGGYFRRFIKWAFIIGALAISYSYGISKGEKILPKSCLII